MQINFYPEYDNADFEKAAKEYAKIWAEEGDKITKAIEKVSGLKFKEKVFNALIYGKSSFSIPLMLSANVPTELIKGTISHELCHRIIKTSNIKLTLRKNRYDYTIDIHRPVMLILYDIWVKLYGKQFAKKRIEFEINQWSEENTNPYKLVWDWALGMTKEQRQKEFKKYFK
jgi:hypothetical protein